MTMLLPEQALPADTIITLRPDPILWPAPTEGERLAGGAAGFDMVELLLRQPGGGSEPTILRAPLPAIRAWAARQGGAIQAAIAASLSRLTAPRPPFVGIAKPGPLIMGIVNATPDSFSDGGDHGDATGAIAHGLALVAAGADLLDIGGESTRPGSNPVPAELELARVIPVIEGLAGCGVPLSIDTSKALVMERALAAGATIINDVRALTADPGALAVAAATEAWVVLMHCQGDPKTMQQGPRYGHVALEIHDYLAARIAACEAAGIARARLAVDPGIGFGKTVAHNLDILRHLALYQSLGCPVLLGVSRKIFIARLNAGRHDPGRPPIVPEPKARLAGSLAAALAGLDAGADILRVHDVAETVQAVAVWRALRRIG